MKKNEDVFELAMLFAEDCSPREVRNVLEILKKKAEVLQSSRKKSVRTALKICLAAACGALLLLSAVFAAKVFLPDQRLAQLWGVNEYNLPFIEQGIDEPLASLSRDGVNIRVLQTLSDPRSVYAIVQVQVPETITFTGQTYFETMILSRKEPKTGGVRIQVLEQSEHARIYLFVLETSENLERETLQLRLGNLKEKTFGSEPYKDAKLLLAGEWKLEWEFDPQRSAKSKTVEPNVLVTAFSREVQKEKTVLVKSVTVTPMSVFLDITAENPQSSADNMLATWITVNRKDGTSFDCGKHDVNKIQTAGQESGTLYFWFDSLLDIETVESVTIGDTTIPLEE